MCVLKELYLLEKATTILTQTHKQTLTVPVMSYPTIFPAPSTIVSIHLRFQPTNGSPKMDTQTNL